MLFGVVVVMPAAVCMRFIIAYMIARVVIVLVVRFCVRMEVRGTTVLM